MTIMMATSVLPTSNVATGGASLSGKKKALVVLAIVLASFLAAVVHVQPAQAYVATAAAAITTQAGNTTAHTYGIVVGWLSAAYGGATSAFGIMASAAPIEFALTAAVVVVVWTGLVKKPASKGSKKEALLPLIVPDAALLSASQPKGSTPRCKAHGHDSWAIQVNPAYIPEGCLSPSMDILSPMSAADYSTPTTPNMSEVYSRSADNTAAQGDSSPQESEVAACTEKTVPTACTTRSVWSDALFSFPVVGKEQVAAPYNPTYNSLGFTSDSEDESDDVEQPHIALTVAAAKSPEATPTSAPLSRTFSVDSTAPSSSGMVASTPSLETLSTCSSEFSLDVGIASSSFPADQSPRAVFSPKSPVFSPKSPAALMPVVDATPQALSAVVAEPPSQPRAGAASTQEASADASQALPSVSSSPSKPSAGKAQVCTPRLQQHTAASLAKAVDFYKQRTAMLKGQAMENSRPGLCSSSSRARWV